MKVSLWINVVHIALDYVLIFGIADFAGFSIAGAAIATVVVRILGSFILFSAIKHSTLSFSLRDFADLRNNGAAREISKLALPVMLEKLMMRLGVILYYSAIIKIGTGPYAAHMIASNMESVVILSGVGFEVASTVSVGQNLGAQRVKQAKSYAVISMLLSMLCMSICGLLLYLLAPLIASIFTTDPVIAEMVVIALSFMALYQPPLAIVLIATGALQVSGDTRTPLYSTAIGMWLVRLAGIYYFGMMLGMGITGVWLSIALDIFVRAVFLFWRFQITFRKNVRSTQLKSLEIDV